MSTLKKQKVHLTLDKSEQDIEDNLDISKALPTKEKAHEVAKLKAAAKEHLKKRNKEKRISIRYLQVIRTPQTNCRRRRFTLSNSCYQCSP